MDTFLLYDHFRLNQYRKINQEIKFGFKYGISFCQFKGVDYFNYLVLKESKVNEAEISQVLYKFSENGTDRVKIISPKVLHDVNIDFVDFSKTTKVITCLKREFKENETVDFIENVLFPVKTEKELWLFTKVYLTGFGSNNKNYEQVYKNFKLVYECDNVDFFLIKYNGEVAGVCSSYYDKNHVLLSACTVLAPFKNQGLQKKAIQIRLALGRDKEYKTFTAWAYEKGISHNNMLKSQFKESKFYYEYLSKSLENITKSVPLLSSKTCNNI